MSKSRSVLFAAAGFLVLSLGVSEFADVQAAPMPKETICHFTGNGRPILISVSANAVTSHFQNHGDTFPMEAFVDADGDGFGKGDAEVTCAIPEGSAAMGGDCNDADPAINPFAEDIPGNQIDENCDGLDASLPAG